MYYTRSIWDLLFMKSKLVFVYVGSLMYQIVNLSWKAVVQNAGCVFVYFCGGHKNNFGYKFVAPLS